ncbi:MAG: hypothetical protein R2942_07160 [Ignavibacteria bacterium]
MSGDSTEFIFIILFTGSNAISKLVTNNDWRKYVVKYDYTG